MHGDVTGATAKHRGSARTGDRQCLACKRENGGCPKRNNDFWPHEIKLFRQPPPIMPDLSRGWLLVYALLAALLVFEMLHHVRHVDGLAIQSRFRHGAIQELACAAYKWAPLHIFLVARL